MIANILALIAEACRSFTGDVNRRGMIVEDWHVARMTPINLATLISENPSRIFHVYKTDSVTQARNWQQSLNNNGVTTDAARDNADGLLIVCYSIY